MMSLNISILEDVCIKWKIVCILKTKPGKDYILRVQFIGMGTL